MYKRMKDIKEEKGITLVALVVTIIVLLILAFVAISMIMGDNGIVENAKESKEETIKAQEREFIKLAYQDLEIDYRLKGTDITADRVMEKLSEYDKNIKVEMITKDEIGDTEVVVEKNSGEEYAEIVFTETEHKYAGSLVIDTNKTRYEVTYNANRGSGGPTKQIKIQGTPLTITLERPERKGYNFIGWARESTAVVAEYMSGSQYTEDANITLYAVWQMRDDIEPVAQIGSTKYPSIQEAIYDCNQEAGEEETTIILLKDTEEEFRTYEGQNIILNLQGHTVTSKGEGALCTNNAKLQIINGELRSEKGIAITNNGEITIGENSNGIDDNTPTIYGNNIGVENNGTFNFYDGKIQGRVPIQGTTPNTPDQYGPVQTGYENGITTIQLRILTQYEARIRWVYYETLQGAIDIAKEKETVTLIKNLQLKEVLQIGETKDVILDLNGYSLTVASGLDTVIKNYGDLEITDNSVEQTGNITITTSSTCYGIRNEGEKTLKITLGTVSSSSSISSYSNYSYGIYNANSGSIEVTGGTVSGNRYGIYNNSTGTITVTGGTVSSSRSDSGSSYGIYNASGGIIEVTGGTVSSSRNDNGSSYGIYNASSGIIEVTGGTVSSNSNSNSSYGIYNASSGIIEVTGGTVSSNSNSNSSYGIYNTSSGTVEVTGGTIRNNSNSSSYGIYNASSGIIEVTGGTIRSSNSSSNYYSYGIYNASDGRIIIGDKIGLINIESLQIMAEYIGTSTFYRGIGLYNKTGYVEFNNGTIQGDIPSLGNITKIRDNYKIETEKIGNTEKIYLKEKNNEEYIVQMENKKYMSVQAAINDIGENEKKTIQLLEDFNLNESIIFNKNVILDLNGCTMTNRYFKIENTSNLIITDTSEENKGKIDNINTIIGILNTAPGIIVVEKGTISSSVNTNFNLNYGIYNSNDGIVKINGGTVESSISFNRRYSSDSYTRYCYGIYNENYGKIELINGTIKVNSNCSYYLLYGIYNNGSGIVTIDAGKINVNEDIINIRNYGIYNASNGSIGIRGGIISSNQYGIYNYKDGIITVKGGSINEIYNNSTGDIVIENGTVGGNNYGIYNNSTGSITIGIKGDAIVSQEYPVIKGETYGVYNLKGKLYYYDGKIEGKTKAIYEIITEKEENTYLNYNENETVVTLSTEKLPLAQIGDTVYTDLKDAIEATTEENKTIKIIRNLIYTNDNEVITIPNAKNIILDLNGYKITSATTGKAIYNEGKLEITDTSESKEGRITTNEEITIYNSSGANLIISNGIIENQDKYAIYSDGNVEIIGGTIEGGYGIYNASNGTIEIKGGEISSSTRNKNYGIYNASDGTIKVIGGTVNCKSQYATSYAVYNESNGTIEIAGGNIINTSSNVSTLGYGIYNKTDGLIKVIGGIIQSNCRYDGYGIYNANKGSIEITKGTIICNSKDNWGNGIGIYNNSTGSITIGTKGDGAISQEEPIIMGSRENSSNSYLGAGIYNPNGTLYYYDGKIQGTDKAISGNITEIEEATEINLREETIDNIIYKIVILKQISTNVARVNGMEYNSISKAIELCGEIESTIEILRDSNQGELIKIEENQNIIIDLKGYTINNYTELQNDGILKIIDTSEEQTGRIVGLTGIAISNTGTLEVRGGAISDSGYGIKNTGNVTLSGGNISNNTYGIYNQGTVNKEKGKINSNTYGIYNYSYNNTSTINMKGGEIISNKYGIFNYNYSGKSITNINEGTINSNEYGIYNYNGTTNISSKGITDNTYGIYVAGGTTNIKEGAEMQSETGIYVASGTLNIGESGTMNPDTPIITGETYGLTVTATGTVYMYDGQVKGKEGATEGYITYTEEGYTVANKTEGEYKIDYLALAGTANAVAQVNGISYSNLQSAINSITGGEEQTITLLNGITTSETYTIAEGQNIKLDMNGKTISSDAETTIINNGDLTIVDTSNKNVAKITSTTGVAVKNTGTLTLGEEDGTVNGDVITIEGETKGIENTGTLNIYDGTVIGTTAIEGEVNKTPSGYTITTITVNGKQKATLTK